jgi:DNA helicase-2/ATP-dependent DNA helicase PcrA
VLPAAAEAARLRRFQDDAIRVAAQTSRLQVVPGTADGGYSEIQRIVRAARGQRKSVSVFTHTNQATVALSDALTATGLVHEQVGLGEAYGGALKAQLGLVHWAFDRRADWRRALAVYVAAITRGRTLPPLAQQILDRSNASFERALTRVLDDIAAAAAAPANYQRLGHLIAVAWRRIGTTRGEETWVQASRYTTAALRMLADGSDLSAVAARIEQAHDAALLNSTRARPHPVQVMNLHQTKGREADVTVLLLQPDEFHGRETEPYPTGSRLLYVVLTRARHQAHLVVPARSHGLWQPLVEACTAAQNPVGVTREPTP